MANPNDIQVKMTLSETIMVINLSEQGSNVNASDDSIAVVVYDAKP